MEKRLFGYDDLNAITTWFHADDNGDVHLEYEQDADVVQAILDNNVASQNESDMKAQIKDGWWKYGSIPVGLILKWQIEEGIDVYNPEHRMRVLAKVNDRDFGKLKATLGHHARKDS